MRKKFNGVDGWRKDTSLYFSLMPMDLWREVIEKYFIHQKCFERKGWYGNEDPFFSLAAMWFTGLMVIGKVFNSSD